MRNIKQFSYKCVDIKCHSVPVSGHRDVGRGNGLSLCLWYVPPLCCPEVIGQLCLVSWVPYVQVH